MTARHDDGDQILSLGQASFDHDDAGNLVDIRVGGGEGEISLRYESLGRPVALTTVAETAAWSYDGLGRRAIRTCGAGVTRRIYDGSSVIADLGDDGAVTLETTAGLLVLARHTSEGTRHLHSDASTSIAEVTGESGRLLARYAYTPFGEKRTVEGDPGAAGPLGFCGVLGVREEAGGLLDMRARLYHPGLGRFTSPDPWPPYLPEPVTLNRYLYALGDPISQVDPYGLFCWTGKSHGKCRGLHDVVERVGGAMESGARAVAPGLSFASTVYAGVAAVATGLTFFCPPCGVVTVPLAGFAAGSSFYLGLASTAARCVAAGLNVTTFDCASAVAFTSVGLAARYVGEAAVAVFGKDLKELALLRRTFPIFLKATSKAVPRPHK